VLRNLMAERFQEIFSKRTAEETRTLAHTKRFLERFVADPTFRMAIEINIEASQRVSEAYGIAIDPRQALPLFQPDHTRYRSLPNSVERWPVAKVWDDYRAELDECRELFCRASGCADKSPRFHAWRQRQIRRTESEIGLPTKVITHPMLAFELSDGCSVGCWFCGFSAGRFRGSFLYSTQNAKLWREILEQTVDLFGTAAQAGLCYWATDPCDNPDYPKFIEDYYHATGNLPKTTTAAPLKDLEFTRKVLGLSAQHPCFINRFSILTLKTFNAVQEIFSAEELMRVDLVLQNRESLSPKKPVGRAREREQKRTGSGPATAPLVEANRSTLASLSGFLVNMVERTIKLITPTRTSERWPLGYRVLGERSFGDARDFRAGIDDLILACMPQELSSADIVSFRQDLNYSPTDDGFELRAVNARYSLRGFAGARQLGDMIHEGGKTAGQIRSALVRCGSDIVVATDVLQKLFDRGLLNDDPKLGGVGSRGPAADRKAIILSATAALELSARS